MAKDNEETFAFTETIEDKATRDMIADYRFVFFHPNDVERKGMKVLTDIISVILGLWENVEPDNLSHAIKQNCARKILKNLGILHPANYFDIIQLLASLPVKTVLYSGLKAKKPLIGGQ